MSRTVVSPLERLKILFQIQSAGREAYQLSVGKSLMKIWKDEGWRGFMRGNGTKVTLKWGPGAFQSIDRGLDLAGRKLA